MNDMQIKVREFMVRAEQATPDEPTIPTMDAAILRYNLIREELHEYWVVVDALYAFRKPDLLEQAADAIGDMLYVVLGAAVAWGLDIEPIFNEIHRSNMSKFIDGTRRDDGKYVKGPSYQPADLAAEIRKQLD